MAVKSPFLPHRFWTPAELTYLDKSIQDHRPYTEIAKYLKRSIDSVTVKAGRLGIGVKSVGGARSVGQVAHDLGIDRNTLTGWGRKGIMPLKVVSRHDVFLEDEDLWNWLADERWWCSYDPMAMADAELRDYATLVRRGLTFVTVPQLAQKYNVSVQLVHRWLREGTLHGVKSTLGAWYVRSDWVTGFVPPVGGTRMKYRKYSMREAAFVRRHAASGEYGRIGAKIGRSRESVARWCRLNGLSKESAS